MEKYVAEVEAMRQAKDAAFRAEVWSPIEDRAGFRGLSYFPVDPAYRFPTRLVRHAKPVVLEMRTSDGAAREYANVGHFELPLEGLIVCLEAYRLAGSASLFVPFRDRTSGRETYGAGRYLDLPLEGEDAAVVDFNLAYHPYCAYSDAFSCPFPPPENWLRVRIPAGERLAERT